MAASLARPVVRRMSGQPGRRAELVCNEFGNLNLPQIVAWSHSGLAGKNEIGSFSFIDQGKERCLS
jgi:hypothetical protein